MRERRPRKRRTGETSRLAHRALFLLGLLWFAFGLQFATGTLGSVDGYFHIRYSAILAQAGWRGFPPEFPWLPLTILAPDRYFDHHMLFHAWLAPFARRDLVLGAKLASGIGAWLAFAGSYLFLVWRRIRRPEWWTIALLAGAPGFLYRMEMPRVQSLSLLCLLVALGLLIRRRFVWLLPLAWFYTWLYDAFPLLLGMCACATVAELLMRRTFVWAPLAHSLLGVTGGLVVNPYFPHNLSFISHHYLAKLSGGGTIPVGAEWNPLAVAEWFGWTGLVAVLCGLGVVLYRRRHLLDYEHLTSMLVAAFFLTLLWRSTRFVEYFIPFTAIALAQVAHLRVDEILTRAQRHWRRCAAAALLVWLAASCTIAVVKLRGRPPAARYAGAAGWIAEHTAPGAIVFNAAWDAFPLLYFHNTRNRYVIGLDPTYLAERDPDLYRRWQAIGNGQTARPAVAIRDRFGAVVAFADRRQSGFVQAIRNDPLATKAYEDQESIVYEIRPVPGSEQLQPGGSRE